MIVWKTQDYALLPIMTVMSQIFMCAILILKNYWILNYVRGKIFSVEFGIKLSRKVQVMATQTSRRALAPVVLRIWHQPHLPHDG